MCFAVVFAGGAGRRGAARRTTALQNPWGVGLMGCDCQGGASARTRIRHCPRCPLTEALGSHRAHRPSGAQRDHLLRQGCMSYPRILARLCQAPGRRQLMRRIRRALVATLRGGPNQRPLASKERPRAPAAPRFRRNFSANAPHTATCRECPRAQCTAEQRGRGPRIPPVRLSARQRQRPPTNLSATTTHNPWDTSPLRRMLRGEVAATLGASSYGQDVLIERSAPAPLF